MKTINKAIVTLIAVASMAGAAKAQSVSDSAAAKFRKSTTLNLNLADSAKRFTTYKTKIELANLTVTDVNGAKDNYMVNKVSQTVAIPMGKGQNSLNVDADVQTRMLIPTDPVTGTSKITGGKGKPGPLTSISHIGLGMGTPNFSGGLDGYVLNEPDSAYKISPAFGGHLEGNNGKVGGWAKFKTMFNRLIGGGHELNTDAELGGYGMFPLASDVTVTVGGAQTYVSTHLGTVGIVNQQIAVVGTLGIAYTLSQEEKVVVNSQISPNLLKFSAMYQGSGYAVEGTFSRIAGFDVNGNSLNNTFSAIAVHINY